MSVPQAGEPAALGERLSATEREAWQQAGHRRHYANDEVLLREGEPGQRVLLVQRGLVKVANTAGDGRQVLLAIRGPGEVLGEIAALDGGGHSATVRAFGEVVAHALTPRQFTGFLHENPRVAMALLLRNGKRLRESDGQRLEYGTRTVPQRLASRLLALAEQHGHPLADATGVRIDLRLTQSELAESIAAHRDSVVNALRALRGVGAVEVDAGHRLVLRDLDLLGKIAAGVTQLT